MEKEEQGFQSIRNLNIIGKRECWPHAFGPKDKKMASGTLTTRDKIHNVTIKAKKGAAASPKPRYDT